MDPGLLLYNLALATAAAALPGVYLGGRLAGKWPELWLRSGLFRDLAPAGAGPRVWLQAVSVGEVSVARAVAAELHKAAGHICLTVSASTAKGLGEVRASLGLAAKVAPFPLDFPWSVAAAGRKIRPHVYASLETEIWPNLLAYLDKAGTSLFLLNGRLSPRSFPRYQKIRPLLAPTLRRFKCLSMITEKDAQRVIALGADPGRVRVDGNAKYAGLLKRIRPGLTFEPAARLNLACAPLLVAGSVRTGEEQPVLEAFKRVLEQYPKAVLAAVPRHVERAPRWQEAALRLGLPAQLWSALDKDRPRLTGTSVVVVDAMGVLFGLYGLARAAFLGASLVPLGGQNPIEPAAWGVPVAYGPSMEDFADAAQVLQAQGAACIVNNSNELSRFWQEMLADGQKAAQKGEAGRAVVARWSGAARAAAGLILEELDRKGVL